VSLRDRKAGPPTTHPKGWEPGIVWDGSKGEVSSGPLEDEPDDALWSELVADWGVTRSVRIVPGSVQVRAWDTHDGRRLKYYRARLEPSSTFEDRADVESLIDEIKRRRPLSVKTAQGGDRAFVVLLSDWQVGKGEGGGTPAFIKRLLEAFDRIEAKAKKHKKAGVEVVYLVGLGDLVEQCSGHYAMQAFQTDLDRREQMRVVRRLILDLVERMVKIGLRVVLGAVPGNHGENRNSSGKAYTTWTDNDDLAVFDQVAEILEHNSERYANVSVPLGAIAEDLTMTLDVCGVLIGFAHGHQIRQGGPTTWWMKQSHGKQPIGKADVLCVGHKHHFALSEGSGRVWFQCPAMDGGSYWWTAQEGASSPSGVLTFLAGTGCGERGWSDLAII